MKTKIRSLVAGVMLLAMLNLTVTTSRAAQSPGSTLLPEKVVSAAPTIVANKAPLSAGDLAKYQQKASESKQAANDQAAGAASRICARMTEAQIALIAGRLDLHCHDVDD